MGENCNRKDNLKEHTPEKGDWNKVAEWFQNLEKDDELADNIEEAVKQVRKGLKLKRIKLE